MRCSSCAQPVNACDPGGRASERLAASEPRRPASTHPPPTALYKFAYGVPTRATKWSAPGSASAPALPRIAARRRRCLRYTQLPPQARIDGLSHHDEHAVVTALRLPSRPGYRAFSDFVAGQRTAQRPGITATRTVPINRRCRGPPTSDDGADAAMMVARHLGFGNRSMTPPDALTGCSQFIINPASAAASTNERMFSTAYLLLATG